VSNLIKRTPEEFYQRQVRYDQLVKKYYNSPNRPSRDSLDAFDIHKMIVAQIDAENLRKTFGLSNE